MHSSDDETTREDDKAIAPHVVEVPRSSVTVDSRGSVVGFLNKYVLKGGFRKRWFQLTGETLLYFETLENTEPRGFFWLDGATLQKNGRLAKRNKFHSVLTRGSTMGTPYSLVIRRPTPKGAAWELCADTESDFNAWLLALERAGAQRIDDAGVPTKEEEEDITAGIKQSLTQSVDPETMRKFTRAASRKIAKSVANTVVGTGLVGKKVAEAAVDKAIDSLDTRLKLTDELIHEMAVAVTRAQLPVDSPLIDKEKLKPDRIVLRTIQAVVDKSKAAEAAEEAEAEAAAAGPVSPRSHASVKSVKKALSAEEAVAVDDGVTEVPTSPTAVAESGPELDN